MEQPIPLISVGKDGKFSVEKAALDSLKKINGKIGVVTVAGLYRTGKSYILNRLLNRQSGFEIGSTVNSQTKGIYIWGTPVDVNHNGENMKVLLVDTEGIGSVEKDETHDTKIFALSILMSSFFVYNSFGVIDENALDKLSFITQLSHHIQSRSGDRSEIFPTFLWLLRDFTLDLVDFSGKHISSKQYLENALNPVQDKSGGDRNKTKNEIRKTISQFFRERDCVTLVRPTVNEKELRHIDKVPYQDLRPEFRKEVEALRKRVLDSVEFKTIMGRKMNGEEFGIMCKSYVDAINKGAVPDLKSAWENIGMIENPRAMEESFKQYLSTMKAGMDKAGLPMPNEALEALHRSADEGALLAFNSRKIGDTVDNYIKELKERTFAEYLKYQSLNQEKAVQACKVIFEKLSTAIDDKVTQALYKDVTDLLHDLDALQANYINTSKQQKITLTSAQSEFCNLSPRFWNSVITRTTKYLLREQEVKFGKLQSQLTELQKTYDQVRTDKEAALLDKVRLESLQIQLEKEILGLTASMKDLQQKLTQLASEKSSLEADVKKGSSERVAMEKRMQEEKEAHATVLRDLKKQSKTEKDSLTTTHVQERKDLEIRIAKLGSDQEDYKAQIKKLEVEKDALQRTMQERVAKTEQERDLQVKQERKVRKSMGADLSKEKQDREKERETLASNLAKERNERDRLAIEMAKLGGDKEAAEKTVVELRNQINNNKKEASSNAEKLQNRVDELRKKLEAETEARKKDIEEKESASKQASTLSNSIKKDTAELRRKLDLEEEARKKLQEERDTTVQRLNGKNKDMEKELQELRTKFEESESQRKKSTNGHQKVVTDMARDAKQFQDKNKDMEKELQELRTKFEESESQKRKSTDGHKELMADMTRDAKQFQEKAAKMKTQLAEVSSKQAESEKARQELEEAKLAAEAQLEALTRKNEELQQEMTAIKSSSDQLLQQLKTEKSRKLVSGSLNSNNNSNNNNNKHDVISMSDFAADDVEQPESKKRRVSTPPQSTPNPKKEKTENSKSTKKVEKPKKARIQEEEEGEGDEVGADLPDPNTLTIPQLKRQLTRWDVTLPAQAEKKSVYVADNPNANIGDE